MTVKSQQRVKLRRKIDESYSILFGEDLFSNIAEDIPKNIRYIIITDSNVAPLYAQKLKQALISKNLDCKVIIFPAGEQSKTYEMCGKIFSALSDLKLDRNSMLIALGGGVVGDIAGWIAANFLRGIDYIQYSTTILSQVDASVGGKTGVDLPQAKNSIGAFKQPKAVYIDVLTLKTLSNKEIINGFSEIVKYGVIKDRGLFEVLDRGTNSLSKKNLDFLLPIIETCCKIKREVVQKDPNEKGLRRILNYGHTVGHAIEKLSNFTLPHGYCVAIGMMIAGRIAISMNTGFTQEDLQRQEQLLKKIGLPTTIPNNMSNQDIIEVTTRDKKAKDGKARYCLPSKLGRMCEFNGNYATYVDNEVVEKALDSSR